MSRAAIALACIAVLTGCAGQPTVGEYLTPETACCKEIAEVAFRQWPLGQDLELSLSAGSPTYEILGRRRHFVALKIPEGFEPTAIHVKTYLTTPFLPVTSAVVPEFAFLDRSYQLIDVRPAEGFEALHQFGRSGVMGRVDVPSAARYVMVTASDGSKSYPVIHVGGGASYRVKAAAIGEMAVRLFGEQKKQSR